MQEIRASQGIDIKTLDDEPEVSPHLFWIWKAFTELNYRRNVGFNGPLPITFQDIHAYCSLKGIYSLGDRERLLRFIDVLDKKWMQSFHEKQDKNTPKVPKAPMKRGLSRK